MKASAVASEFRLYLANRWISWFPSHTVRLFYYRRIMGLLIGEGSSILMGCQLDCARGIRIGRETTINQNCRLDARGTIQIGDFVSISANVTILTADHDPDSPEGKAREEAVVIDNYCFVGTGATILKGVHLGTAAVVGAGSVITRAVPAGEIWAGNPARKIRMRKIDTATYEGKYWRLFQ